MSTQKSRKRSEIEEKYTWDLRSMYKDLEAFESDFSKAQKMIQEIKELEGTLGQSPEHLAKAIEMMKETERIVENLYVYSHLVSDQDQTVSASQSLQARTLQLITELDGAIAFFDPELLAIEEEKLNDFVKNNEKLQSYRQFLDNAVRFRPHVLSHAEELLLAKAGEIFATPSKTFGLLTDADLKFPTIKDEEGHEVELTHSVYGKMLESSDRRVRREAFQQYYSVFEQFKNTYASLISSQMKAHNYQAKVRHFDSARQAALFQNNVPESVYDTLLEAVHSRLSLLHRYVALRKDLLGIDDLEMYDMYTPLLGEPPIKVTYEEAQSIILKAVKPMGEDYVAIMKEAFADRWIDLYENIGKRSGAYSSGTYDSKPYILMNWQDSINHLYTLIHELGHSAHSYLSRENQEHIYSGYSIFLAEIASTTNENLLTYYLLDKYEDPEIRLFIINHFLDGAKGTVFRQTQFAEFEHFMHTADAEGKPLTQEFLSDNYRELNAKYYGEAVNSDSEIILEWSRIPHFYYNYYVFQYATGFSAATYFAAKIYQGDKEALENYKGFLKSGSSKYAVNTMKDAGLDMTQADYILATLDVFEERLDEFETLLKEHRSK
ncbi:oligoendopeptidase F [Facklamia miroungae]|uniref:Oligopeptidase F n=1 Tax=Facklamia miroungae TaxID=120956 RepID=A0A1G7TKC5_9LACT|nr:oligoendopeptidase F [Facklamia miroungae]NKZ29800.1 oligoendopeptidase F [Facklamia miroungae]SDG35787.1 oligoendopeptidase F [Facklamia miroungae]